MLQNSKSGGTASRVKFAHLGASTRPTTNQVALDISLPRRGQNLIDRGFPSVFQARWFRWAFKNHGATVAKDSARALVSRRAAREVLEQHGARRLRSTTSNSCIASGDVNSPPSKPAIWSTALGSLTPMNASSMTGPFVNLRDNRRRSASLKICDLR